MWFGHYETIKGKTHSLDCGSAKMIMTLLTIKSQDLHSHNLFSSSVHHLWSYS